MSELSDGGIKDEVCFPRNKDGWILVSQVLGHKVIVTSTYEPKIKRESNKGNQHREFVIELNTSVKIKSKLEIDISKFVEDKKNRG
mgnify:CR=1 FL=1